jgi:F-box protein 9
MADSEELRRFREEWMREVNSRRPPEPTVEQLAAGSEGAGVGVAARASDLAGSPTVFVSSNIQDASQSSPVTTTGSFIGPGSPTSRQSALQLYTQAVSLEAQGNLDAATSLYRRAFRLDPHVDKTYHRVGNERDINVGLVEGIGALSLGQRMLNGRYTLKGPTSASQKADDDGYRNSSGAIRTILSSFPSISQLSFLPEDESQPVPINKLPDELIVLILYQFVENVDTRSIERFGSISRRARVVTLDRGLWRYGQ